MDVPDQFLDRIELAKSQFKDSMCLQVDQLFATFVAELKTHQQKSTSIFTANGFSQGSSKGPLVILGGHRKAIASPKRNPEGMQRQLTSSIANIYALSRAPTPPTIIDVPVLPPAQVQVVSKGPWSELPSEYPTISITSTSMQNSIRAPSPIPEPIQAMNIKEEIIDEIALEDEFNESDCASDCNCEECHELGIGPAEIKVESTETSETAVNGKRPAKRQRINENGSWIDLHESTASTSSSPSSVAGPSRYQCRAKDCTASFNNLIDLKRHREIHDRPFVCPFQDCGKSFRSSAHLKDHTRIHMGIRPYKCRWEHCDYLAAQRSDVIKHIRIVHFRLPRSLKEQAAMNITDDRNPADFLEVREDLLSI